MAVLNKIRQRSLFLILVIAMALFSFVLADLFKNSSGFSVTSQDVIAEVNGEQIKREEFARRIENMSRQFGNSRTSMQVMSLVWDQELRKTILEGQYEELGLSVERDQMRSLLQNTLIAYPEFKNEAGLFDEDRLNEFIANLKANPEQPIPMGDLIVDYQAWTNIENNVATTGLEQTYFNLVRAGITGTLAEGELEYKLENDKVDIRYVQIPFTSIPDSTITVTNNDVSKYVNDHKEEYQVDASRDIYFVDFPEVASVEDEEEIQANLVDLLEGKEDNPTTPDVDETREGFRNTVNNADFLAANSEIGLFDQFVFKNQLPSAVADSIYDLEEGGIYGPYKDAGYFKITKVIETKQIPDSVNVRHILVPFVGAVRAAPTVTKTDSQAKVTADSIYNAIRGGAKFLDLLSLSSDQVSNTNDGEIKFAYGAAMAPEFKAFSFENSVGDLEVVRTDFGYHIIEILEQGEANKAVKVGHLAQRILPTKRTLDGLFNEMQKFEIAIANEDFRNVAEEKGYVVKPVSGVKDLDETIPGLGAQRSIVKWIYEDGVGVGNFKSFNLPGGGHAVVIVTSINKEGLMDAEKASVTALPKIRKEKKAELIKSRITGATLDEIASSEGQSVKTAIGINMKNPTLSGAGREPYVIGTAFGLVEGEISNGFSRRGNF
jgi:parvulin-like peptidyl-prolyl isomerase